MLTTKECYQARISKDPRFDGLFFILVKTTKIFCRNVCTVRPPLEHNVSYAQTAQEALEQGYRPCLRCRPDSAPNSPAWQGTNTTVKRAIHLLNTRLDASIEDISSALGITSRYLHKLFSKHLQVSPKRYRIYQQVLSAKSLLEQSSLPIEAVAQAVGFSSSRQLQTHLKRYLRLTPSALRKTSKQQALKQASVDVLSQNVSLTLSYRPPYDWPRVRDFLALRQIHGNENVKSNSVEKVLNIEEHDVAIHIQHRPDKHAFVLSFNAQYSRYSLQIVNITKRLLDLSACPSTIANALSQSGLPAEKQISGLRIPGVASEFEAICRAILGQQVSVVAAINKLNQFYSYFSELYQQQCFPSPSQVCQDSLEFLNMPRLRRASLLNVATYYAQLDPNQAINIQQRSAELLAIKGIGPWTLSYVKLRGLGLSDEFLDGDLVVKQQLSKLATQGIIIDTQAAAPWRSYLSLQLWGMSE